MGKAEAEEEEEEWKMMTSDVQTPFYIINLLTPSHRLGGQEVVFCRQDM